MSDFVVLALVSSEENLLIGWEENSLK